ncbi:D-beta-hydroxybutyrate dehydrogenase, mitochondrial [Diorhabda carinulata]|uniref:D-beta-hydroxybutyrate dehydrogenase, mitochondrial n=1 Tax=Diorhabda sublineata TaxID=1163346 RepID=UPI0024E051F9|nr:D-beta-hydroxybutyrate dehydrogenase, mitochondrial [Diorhabda sublineata]XP_056647612.1 D-beta-hydroxybutyrate dehydrogenase, mitochondrial [Diorhabda sublineata]XP_056647613.1 D-beta-hydroxybutyrate dehydrogenase, mitochondrial [Diorhabda sublineata]XP_056647614.1 D-beta-hydroxybutyrate dehydrogenase, mitochondrial [Diorhabda sublineata]XP_057670449.1 D-beta-hydroxybutyrate dehydrogenase, mitochondrial [Diorhabda carinulata]XP_057670450.1 D-beta-hydroxybutyrate dehydrogenase, mitochondria
MSGPFKRRSSIKTLPAMSLPVDSMRRASIRRTSIALGQQSGKTAGQQEVPWDILDRCLLPVIFCHATAVLVSNALNVLKIWEVTTFTLFIWFTIVTIGAVLFYHNLKVTAAGKAVLITGCDSRVGSALARQLDEQGFTVFAGFQNASTSSAAEELKEVCSGRLHVLQLDVASETQILAASLYAVEHLPDGAPGLWAVVHAQSWVALGEIEWIPPQVIKKATDINFIGPTRVTQIMLPLVRRAKGRIVMVTSGLCRVSSPVRGIHCGLLAALESQAECLRKELKSRGVDVVVVAPGELTSGSSWLSDQHIIDQAKDMWKQLGQEQKSEYGEHYFETALRSLEKHTKAQEVDLFPVLRALNDAVIRTFPLAKYTPVSRKEKIQVFIAEYFPRSVYDVIYS